MKSACPSIVWQRVRVGCERIYKRIGHFPSELAGSRSYSTNSPARSDTVKGQAKCWLCSFAESKCGWYRGKTYFRPESRNGFGIFCCQRKTIN